MSGATKYSTGRTRWEMIASVPVTKHAIERYRERTPHDAPAPAVAWSRGEDVEHPTLLAARDDTPPVRGRIYNHNNDWYIVFVIVPADDRVRADEIVVTTYGNRTKSHEPTRAYLRAHGPHYTDSENNR